MSPLLTANDDFSRKTLAAVPGVLGKLRYVSGLRLESGEYRHWGLSKVYGERTAQRAIVEAHRTLVLQVLRMSLRELLDDAAVSCAAGQDTSHAYIMQLKSDRERLLPSDIGGGSAQHFNTVLDALESLIRGGRDANRRVS